MIKKRVILKATGIIFAVMLLLSSVTLDSRKVEAHGWSSCGRCAWLDCFTTELLIREYFDIGTANVLAHITASFELYRIWLQQEFFEGNLLPAMMMMTEQLSAVGMHQMFAVGAIFDAKLQLETQRLQQQLRAEAIHAYQPSEEVCYFGTNVRSLASAEGRGDANAKAMNSIAMTRMTGEFGNAASTGPSWDKRARWEKFQTTYCNPYNNGFDVDAEDAAGMPDGFTGLSPACEMTSITALADSRRNADLDYQRLVDGQRTINMDLVDGSLEPYPFDMPEDDVLSLMKNIYGHDVPRRDTSYLNRKGGANLYLDLRATMAKRNVAQNSFNNIVSLKTKHEGSPNVEYIRRIIANLGVADEVESFNDILGENPSYYAQLEVLAKRLYQNQSFYANLYDKPENVRRTSLALEAIELMVDREKFESRLRQEMMVSVLLSSRLDAYAEDVSDRIDAARKRMEQIED